MDLKNAIIENFIKGKLDSPNLKDTLLKADRDQLHQILLEDPIQFLQADQKIGDDGEILVYALNDDAQLSKTVLEKLKVMFKKDKTQFVLRTYLTVISNINVSSDYSIFLPLIYPEHEYASMALMIVVKSLQNSKSTELIQNFLDINIDLEIEKREYLNVIKVMSLLFPVVPEIMGPIYIGDSCKIMILEKVKQATTNLIDEVMLKESLVLVGNSSILEDCRQFNATNYLTLLKVGANYEKNAEIQVLSILDIVKLWNFIGKDSETHKNEIDTNELEQIALKHLLISTSLNLVIEYCIEALAYLSLNATIKPKLRSNTSLIAKLISMVNSGQDSNIYGVSVILSNLAKIPDAEGRSLNQLKKLAAASQEQEEDIKQAMQSTKQFNKDLIIKYRVIEKFVKLKTTSDMVNILNQFLNIAGNIAFVQDKLVRLELVKQGVINIVIGYLMNNSHFDSKTRTATPKSTSSDSIETRLSAIRILIRILVSIDPKLVFNKYSVISTIPFMVECLGPDLSKYEGGLIQGNLYLMEKVTSLDKFETLLALTNISASEDASVKQVIIQQTFDSHIDSFLVETTSPSIQLSAWELISNLIDQPSMLKRFFDNTPQSTKRLELMVILLDSQSEKLQTTIAGLLANATGEYQFIAQVIMQNDAISTKLFNIINNIFKQEIKQTDLVIRVCYILFSLIETGKAIPTHLKTILKSAKSNSTEVNLMIEELLTLM